MGWLARHARPGHRPHDLALRAFGEGFAVPEQTVRAAFIAAIGRVVVPGELSGGSAVAPNAAVSDLIASGLGGGSLVPARVRRIDRGLARMGIDWANPELASLDPGFESGDGLVENADAALAAAQMALTGGDAADVATLGKLARAMAPDGAAAPFAGRLEYQWPDQGSDGVDNLVDEEGNFSLLPKGDFRDHLREVVHAVSPAELLAAWHAAELLPAWADDLCEVVEREIAAGTPGQRSQEWFFAALGPSRSFLMIALRDRKRRPADTAMTAMLLISMRLMLDALRERVPDGHFDLLAHPVAMPAFLTDFMSTRSTS